MERLAVRFAGGGLESPRLLAEWLLAWAWACPRLELPLRRDLPVPPAAAAAIAAAAARLLRGEPLQYVLGTAAFMGWDLRVDGRALIPRPETELLVDRLLQEPAAWARPAPRVADVGTGSGCIAIALALRRPAARVLGIDRSPAALDLARANAAALGAADRITWRQGDLLAGQPPASLDVVVANLPYVTTAEWQGLPPAIREHEPRLALDGGPDGLDAIRKLIPQAWQALDKGGIICLEIGAHQGAEVRGLLRSARFSGARLMQDDAGYDRILIDAKEVCLPSHHL